MILIHNTLSFFTWYSSPPKGPPVSASPRKYDKINNCPIFQDQWFEKSFLKYCHKNLQKKQFSLKWLFTQKLKFAHAARPFIKILYFYITIFIKGKLHANFNLYVNRHSTIMTIWHKSNFVFSNLHDPSGLTLTFQLEPVFSTLSQLPAT